MEGEGADAVTWTFTARAERWEARRDLWVLVTVPAEISEEIAAMPHPPAGWDSVKVRARVGLYRWSTSVFPGGNGLYSLALNRAVRDTNGIEVGDLVEIELEVAT